MTSEFKRKRQSDPVLKAHYLPDWNNDVHWRKLHEKGLNDDASYKRTGFKTSFPTVNALKKYCFKNAAEDKDLNKCNPIEGWCEPCLREDGWD